MLGCIYCVCCFLTVRFLRVLDGEAVGEQAAHGAVKVVQQRLRCDECPARIVRVLYPVTYLLDTFRWLPLSQIKQNSTWFVQSFKNIYIFLQAMLLKAPHEAHTNSQNCTRCVLDMYWLRNGSNMCGMTECLDDHR